jgi:uncharacterized RDD family membrane protein YckC
MNEVQPEYVGFWARVGASIIDTILLLIVCIPLVTWYYGSSYWLGAGGWFIVGPMDFLINWIFPAVAVILFWMYRQATPGKMAIGAKIVDAKTGGRCTTGQLIGRYLAYYISTLALMLGFIWVGIDPKKQGFHDKLAGTVVVRSR